MWLNVSLKQCQKWGKLSYMFNTIDRREWIKLNAYFFCFITSDHCKISYTTFIIKHKMTTTWYLHLFSGVFSLEIVFHSIASQAMLNVDVLLTNKCLNPFLGADVYIRIFLLIFQTRINKHVQNNVQKLATDVYIQWSWFFLFPWAWNVFICHFIRLMEVLPNARVLQGALVSQLLY